MTEDCKSNVEKFCAPFSGLLQDHTTYKLPMLELQKLLNKVLNTLDASLPNKQQHKAATHIVREAFDKIYFVMLRTTHPESTFEPVEGMYAVEPSK